MWFGLGFVARSRRDSTDTIFTAKTNLDCTTDFIARCNLRFASVGESSTCIRTSRHWRCEKVQCATDINDDALSSVFFPDALSDATDTITDAISDAYVLTDACTDTISYAITEATWINATCTYSNATSIDAACSNATGSDATLYVGPAVRADGRRASSPYLNVMSFAVFVIIAISFGLL